MDLIWLPFLALGIGLYFFFLSAYRLWLAGKRLFQSIKKTSELGADLMSYERPEVVAKHPVTKEQLVEVLKDRRKLVNKRRKLQVERQRRLINRIREIEIDKRWA